MAPIFTTILATLAALAAPILADDHCTPPGEYMCAFIISSDILAFPTLSSNGAIFSSNSGNDIVDGGCNSILSSGEMDPLGSGNGFYGDFYTTYGTELKAWADIIGDEEVDGLNFLYNNQDWYYEENCQSTKWGFVCDLLFPFCLRLGANHVSGPCWHYIPVQFRLLSKNHSRSGHPPIVHRGESLCSKFLQASI